MVNTGRGEGGVGSRGGETWVAEESRDMTRRKRDAQGRVTSRKMERIIW